MNDRFRVELDQVSSDLKSICEQLHQQVATATKTAADNPSGKPNYADNILNLDTSREVDAPRPTLSQPSGSSCVPSARSGHSLSLVVYGISECKKGTPKHL